MGCRRRRRDPLAALCAAAAAGALQVAVSHVDSWAVKVTADGVPAPGARLSAAFQGAVLKRMDGNVQETLSQGSGYPHFQVRARRRRWLRFAHALWPAARQKRRYGQCCTSTSGRAWPPGAGGRRAPAAAPIRVGFGDHEASEDDVARQHLAEYGLPGRAVVVLRRRHQYA